MKPFNREKFLLWMLAGLLAWQCSLFDLRNGDVRQRERRQTQFEMFAPDLADNYSKFVQVSLGALLGLLAGSTMSNSRRPE